MPQATRAKLRTRKPVPEPLIGSFLLESITTGMYGERKNAIREYVQNRGPIYLTSQIYRLH